MNIKKLFAIEPQITDTAYGPEPSLRDVLVQYYLTCSTLAEAKKLADEYIEAIVFKSHYLK